MIKITSDRWRSFEYYHSVYQKQVPNWRFGMAAHTFFAKDLEGIITPEDDHELYLTEDPAQAQRIINRYIEVDNWFQFVYTNDT